MSRARSAMQEKKEKMPGYLSENSWIPINSTNHNFQSAIFVLIALTKYRFPSFADGYLFGAPSSTSIIRSNCSKSSASKRKLFQQVHMSEPSESSEGCLLLLNCWTLASHCCRARTFSCCPLHNERSDGRQTSPPAQSP